jgi:cell wall-associated NlpC family hydrolase
VVALVRRARLSHSVGAISSQLPCDAPCQSRAGIRCLVRVHRPWLEAAPVTFRIAEPYAAHRHLLALPARTSPPTEILRTDYLAALQRYSGVAYYWGGETGRGIDCSGLIRRGLIDALFLRGMRTLDSGLVRQAISLWWHDCTASALGDEHRGLTVRVLATPSVNVLDHSKVRPGDLAVTTSGVHIMAYLGNNRWIEADPGEGCVITVTAPSKDNIWFRAPMNIVRWSILQ